MQVAQILFYNMYIPKDISHIVDEYYTVQQQGMETLYRKSQTKNSITNRRDIQLNYLINDDIQLSANSSYMSLGDYFDMNTLSTLVNSIVSSEGGFSGATNATHNNFRNIFNYSLWEKTEPMNIHVKMVLYSKTDPLLDVMIPTYMIMSHAGLDKLYESNGTYEKYAVPGISFQVALDLYKRDKVFTFETQLNIKESSKPDTVTPKPQHVIAKSKQVPVSQPKIQKPEESGVSSKQINDYLASTLGLKPNPQPKPSKSSPKNSTSTSSSKPKEPVVQTSSSSSETYGNGNSVYNSKLLSCLIDGLVYIDLGMIKSVTTTFSKHTAKTNFSLNSDNENSSTFSGDFPIWAEIDLQIESSKPAVSYMLWDALNSSKLSQKNSSDFKSLNNKGE
jgi:hypothetical protein